jgi:hypothetical protein
MIKFFKHRRADKYLFANKETYRGKSYRDLWRASGQSDTFENWLKSEGIDLSKYRIFCINHVQPPEKRRFGAACASGNRTVHRSQSL